MSSADRLYESTNTVDQTVTIRVTDDDQADTKLVPSSTSFKLKFLGPLTLSEGESETFDVQLDTKPENDEVTVRVDVQRPRADTPTSISVSPSKIVFRRAEWTLNQKQTKLLLCILSALD